MLSSNFYIYRYGKFRLNCWKRFPHFVLLSLACIVALAWFIYEVSNISEPDIIHYTKPRVNDRAVALSYEIRVPYEKSLSIIKAVDKCYSNTKIPRGIMLSLINKESTFKENAVSTAGALGLTQVLVRWHHDKYIETTKRYPNSSVFDINFNIELGCSILKDYLANTSSMHTALERYRGHTISSINKEYATSIIKGSHKWEKLAAL